MWKYLNEEGKISDNAQQALTLGSWNWMSSGKNKMIFFNAKSN